MDADDALERLQAQLVTMNAPAELRHKLMAMAATCEEAYRGRLQEGAESYAKTLASDILR